MPKKIIVIFIIVFILIGGGMLAYYFSTNTKETPSTQNNTNTTPEGYQQFNPFGTGIKTNTDNTVSSTPENNTNTSTITPAVSTASKFYKITDFAVAGAGYFDDTRPLPEEIVTATTATVATPVETTPSKTKSKKSTPKVVTPPAPKVEIVPSIRYVERSTGHIHQMYLDNGTRGKISNSTIPGIYEAIFDSKAKSVIYRYLSTLDGSITSFLATLGSQNNSFLPSNIEAVTLSPDKSKFFYLAQNSNGVTGTIGSFEETKRTQVFSSPFSEWIPQWVGDKTIFLTTKASYLVNGTLFSMNTNNGYMTKVLGGVPGLTTLANNKGNVVLYSVVVDSGPKLGIFNVNTHATKDINMYGLPEKCVWSVDNINVYCAVPRAISGNQYPDIWYQGLVSFDDNFIKINSNDGSIVALAESSNSDPIDGTSLFLSKDESILFFINKKDSTLWGLGLK